MLKNNFMRPFFLKIFLFKTVCIFCILLRAEGQNYSTTTNYFDIDSIIYSTETGEDIIAYRPLLVRGYSGYFFSAGEYSKEKKFQGIRMANFDKNGLLLSSVVYNNPSYREYVKKVVATYKSLYVICNAVNTNDGDSDLLILRYNFNMELKGSKVYSGSKYYMPVNGSFAIKPGLLNNIDEIYFTCFKKDNLKSSLAVLNIDSNLTIQHFFEYNYSGHIDKCVEKPIDMNISINSSNIEDIYVAGNIINNNNSTQNLLIKLDNKLNALWIKTDTSQHETYYSVKQTKAPSDALYVAGAVETGGLLKWRLEKIDPTTGNTIISAPYANTRANCVPLRITVAGNEVIVAGYQQDINTGEYDVVLRVFAANLEHAGTYPYSNILKLTKGSSLNDVVAERDATWITGSRGVGSNRYLFTYKLGNKYGSIIYSDSIKSLNAAALKIAILDGGASYPDSSRIAITGFKNNTAQIFRPEDLSFVSRFYIPQPSFLYTKNDFPDFIVAINKQRRLTNYSSGKNIMSVSNKAY